MRLLAMLFILFSLFANAKEPLEISKITPYGTKTSAGYCIYFNHDIYISQEKIKPFITIKPKSFFEVEGYYNHFCITGLKPGKYYHIIIDKNIPFDSFYLVKNYSFFRKSGDLKPSWRFKESGYILPLSGQKSIPLESVNIDKLKLKLYRINDRNLIYAINTYGLARAIDEWEEDDIKDEYGALIWEKTLKIPMQKNKKIVTAIPINKELQELKPGIYLLTSSEDGYYEGQNSQWFLISDIGIFTLKGEEGLHVYLKHLSNATPISQAKVELIAKNNEILATATSNKQGYAFFKAALLQGQGGMKPVALYIFYKKQFNVLLFSRPKLDLTDRGVSGREVKTPYDGFIYTNRGIFKPNSTIPFTLLLRDSSQKAAANVKLVATLYDSAYKKIATKSFVSDDFGKVEGNFTLSPVKNQGLWSIEVKAGENIVATLKFLVEDFIPPKIEVKVLKKVQFLQYNKVALIKLQALYLSGGALENPKGSYEIILKKSTGVYNRFKDYFFGKIDEEYSGEYLDQEEFVGDSNGTIEIPIKITSSTQTTLPLEAIIKITVNDPGGRGVDKVLHLFYADKDEYIGIKPLFEYDMLDLNEKPKFYLIVVQNNKLIKKKLSYRLIQEEAEYDWYFDQESGEWNYNESYNDIKVVKKGTIDVLNQPTPLTLEKLNWGNYRLEVYDKNQTISSYRFFVGYDESKSKVTPDRLTLKTDKKVYTPNEKIKIQIEPKFNGPILLHIASNKILYTKELKAKANNNIELSLPIKKEWGSSIYILATQFRAQKAKLGATRAIGVAPVLIRDKEKVIKLTIKAPQKTVSKKALEVKVQSPFTKKAYVQIMAVDKGILNLTNYKAPNPLSYFFGQKMLGVSLQDIYGELIKSYGEHGEFATGAGEEELEVPKEKPITNKREVVAFMSKVLPLNKEAKVSIKIGEFQGKLQIMAVAWGKEAVGSAKTFTIIKDPISIESYLPRFLSVGDKANVLFSFEFDKNLSKGKYHVEIKSDDALTFNPSSFVIENNGSKVFQTVSVSAKKESPLSKFNIIVKGAKAKNNRHFALGIRNPYPQIFEQKVGLIQSNKTLDIQNLIHKDSFSYFKKFWLTISAAVPIDKAALEDRLIHYCCRCAEQTTSRAFPFIYKKDAFYKKLVQKAIERLAKLEKINGSFGLWAESSSDLWVSAYVVDFLTQAKKAGFKVNQYYFKTALGWLDNQIYRNASKEEEKEANIYALYVLTKNGKIYLSDLNYYLEQNTPKSAFALGLLGASFEMIGKKEKAKAAFEKALNGDFNTFSNYGGSLRNKAALSFLLAKANLKDKAFQLFFELAKELSQQYYLSPQEISWILRAANALNYTPKKDITIALNGKKITTKRFFASYKSLQNLPQIQNKNNFPIYYILSFSAIPNAKGLSIYENKGFTIEKHFFTLEGKEIDLSQVAQNQKILVVIDGTILDDSITHPVIVDLLPAGFEIENPNISGVNEVSSLEIASSLSALESAKYKDDRFIAALKQNEGNFSVAYIVRAVTKGRFKMAPSYIEDMYKPAFHAISKAILHPLVIKDKSQINIKEKTTKEQNNTSNKHSSLKEEDFLKLQHFNVSNLKSFSIYQLFYLRNAIFAMHGLDFSKTNPALNQYFKQFNWYKPNTSDGAKVYASLSPIEKHNVLTLLKEEKSRLGGLVLSDFNKLFSQKLNAKTLAKKYSKKQLRILKNALFARYGYSFKDKTLRKIFMEFSWYKPNEAKNAQEIMQKEFTPLDMYNFQVINQAFVLKNEK